MRLSADPLRSHLIATSAGPVQGLAHPQCNASSLLSAHTQMEEEEGGNRKGKGKGKEKEKKWRLFLPKECYNLLFGISGGTEWND